ncbi:MAG: glycosyltransferase, partial [Clostridiales bacterium]|nr:glycosyltransferase [Clostridiales bacterium]
KYSEKDNFIYINSDKNQGISAARNKAVKSASGEYLIFVDSDDYIQSSLLCDIEEYVIQGVDLIKWNALITEENYNYLKNDLDLAGSYPELVKFDICNGSEAFNNLFGKDNLLSCVWCYAIKKKIFERFPEGRYHEDYAKMILMILKAKTAVSIGKYEYNYVMSNNSIMRNKSIEKMEKKMVDILFNFDNLIEKIDKLKIDQFTRENAYMYAMYSLVVVENDLCHSLKKIFHKELRKRKVYKYIAVRNFKSFIKKILFFIKY